MALNILQGEYSPAEIRIRIAFHILNEVVPRMLEEGTPITTKVALAYTWLRFVCKVLPRECPENLPHELEKWRADTIERVAEILITYAVKLLGTGVLPPETATKIAMQSTSMV